MTLYQVVYTLPYLVVIPIEVSVLMWLACTQVGVASAFIAMVPFVLFAAGKMVFVSVAAKRLKGARELSSLRFGVLHEGITGNIVVKLFGYFDMLMAKMDKIRSKETPRLLWGVASTSTTLWLSMFLGPAMAWVASE